MATKPRKRTASKKVDAGELTRRVGRLVDVLRKQPEQTVTLADVAGVTEVLIGSLDRYMGSIDTSLYRECQALTSHIAQTRAEIAELSPQDLTTTKIPRAGQELDAIVKATEDATGEIMSAAEEMMAADGTDAAALKTMVDAACMRIFEACAFQDITGQRIAKVVNTLSFIEERLSNLQKVWSESLGETIADAKKDEGVSGDAALLNGPALAGEGINQTDVDALMNHAGQASPAISDSIRVGDAVNGGTDDAVPLAASPGSTKIPRVSDVLGGGSDDATPTRDDLDAKIDALFQ
jgi:chemotaxis protein CheZ